MKKHETVAEYLARIGAKGGKVTGESKKRGDESYYKRISRKAVAAKRRKAAAAAKAKGKSKPKG
jgi:hypothetical protein